MKGTEVDHWHVYEMDRGRLMASFNRAEPARVAARAIANDIDDTVVIAFGYSQPPEDIGDSEELVALGFVLESVYPDSWDR